MGSADMRICVYACLHIRVHLFSMYVCVLTVLFTRQTYTPIQLAIRCDKKPAAYVCYECGRAGACARVYIYIYIYIYIHIF